MAYKQRDNPFKKLHEGLQGFGERHAAWKAKREAMPQKKYGYGSEGSKAYRAGKKAGESRFQYDVRMRKERRREEKYGDKPLTRTPEQIEGIDPKHEINIDGADAPSWDWEFQEKAEGDLRKQETTNFGITDEMSFNEAFKQAKLGGIEYGSVFEWQGDPYKFEYEQPYRFLNKEKTLRKDIVSGQISRHVGGGKWETK
jgi:hypothetical protein